MIQQQQAKMQATALANLVRATRSALALVPKSLGDQYDADVPVLHIKIEPLALADLINAHVHAANLVHYYDLDRERQRRPNLRELKAGPKQAKPRQVNL
jgi:hypothetical protein